MNTEVLELLFKHIEKNMRLPSYKSKFEFEDMSTARWTAYEIANLLMIYPWKSPDDIVFLFISKMEYFIRTADNIIISSRFLTAKSTAEEIYNLLQTHKEAGYSV